ncbi:MAG TPA: YciI family protein [Gaiellaceae bacterium]|jgi:hypothetical protein
MQYMFLLYSEEGAWESRSEDERRTLYAEYAQLNGDLHTQGKLISGDELQPVATATTVQVRKGETLVSDGPFAETKEALGGYYLIDAESLDEAIEWAAKIPSARDGKIEIRPVVDRTGAGA